MQTFDFIPADTLFFRDARPLAAGSGYGHGANWPLPTVLHGALRASLLRLRGEAPSIRTAGYERRGRTHGSFASESFNWLNLRGPFPFHQSMGLTYFPMPRDLVPADHSDKPAATRLRLITSDRTANLPEPLTFLAASFAPQSKKTLSSWVDVSFYNDYLAGRQPLGHPEQMELWDSEYRTGVAIDPESQTAAEGQLYAAEHLRLRPGITLRFMISSPQANGHLKPGEQEAYERLPSCVLQLGGESRCGTLVPQPEGSLSMPNAKVDGCHVKWVILTPAIFIGGWLPGWVDAKSGEVRLRIKPEGFDRRAQRRNRRGDGISYAEGAQIGTSIKAKLVAACTGKPQVVGGWDLAGGPDATLLPAPKPTQLAVPSGSVYYFEAANPEEAQKLAASLDGRCRSDFYGEKGLGLGVCGNWTPDVPGRQNI